MSKEMRMQIMHMKHYEARRRPVKMSLLVFVGRAGAATITQCLKHLSEENERRKHADESEIWRVILDAVTNEYLFEVRANFDTEGHIILCLSVAGYRKIFEYNQYVADELIFGAPTDYRIRNIRHDLLIGEGLINWSRNYEVLSFENESKLRSNNMIHRAKMLKENGYIDADENSSLPDYAILAYHREEERYNSFNCEAAVRYKRAKIDSKKKYLNWYTDTEYQADKIHCLTGEPVTVLKPLKDAINPEFDRAVRRALLKFAPNGKFLPLTKLEIRIWRVLEETKMMLSLRELKLFIEAGPQAVGRAITELIKLKAIASKTVEIIVKDKAPETALYVYTPKSRRYITGPAFYQHLMLNSVLMIASEHKSVFLKFDPAIPALTLKNRNRRTTYLSDDPAQSVATAADRLREASQKYRHTVRLVVNDIERYKQLCAEPDDIALFSLTTHDFEY